MQKVLLTIALVSLTALAGCSDAPPSGEFTADQSAFSLTQSSMTLQVTPAENPYATDVPQIDGLVGCTPDTVTGNDPNNMAPTCQAAYSEIAVNAQSLPEAASGYSLYVVVNGTDYLVGALEQMEGMDHYTLDTTVDEDLSGASAFQLRDGDITVGVAPGDGGGFEVAPALQGIVAACTYEGKDLTCDVTGGDGLPLRGWLVLFNEETQALDHEEPFDLTPNGTTMHTAMENIVDYAEFHVHLGTSSINVAKVAIA